MERNPRLVGLVAGFAESSFPSDVVLEGVEEGIPAELRPMKGRDEDFRIGGLEEEEVTEAEFARGPDDEVWVGQILGLKVA